MVERISGALHQPGRQTRGLHEQAGDYELGLAEHELVALWLLGRIPASVLPWPLLRAGRAGRGPGPDVREVVFQHPSGVPLAGDVEIHLRASDFVRHGHATDAAYNGVILHVVWQDDRQAEAGAPTALPNGDFVLTVAIGPALDGDPSELRELVRLGPSGGEPCGPWAAARSTSDVRDAVRAEGRRRLAERAWGAGRLVELSGWEGAWEELLIRALRASAGRRRESDVEQRALAARVSAGLSGSAQADDRPPVGALPALERLARTPRPAALIDALRQPGGPGRARAIEIGWNAALPLLAAAAAAYGDRELASNTAALVAAWPAPRPYGRTEALARLVRPGGTAQPRDSGAPDAPRGGGALDAPRGGGALDAPRGGGALDAPRGGGALDAPRGGGALYAPRGGGALYAQGLLHVQDLWCERGGCGVCPLSADSFEAAR